MTEKLTTYDPAEDLTSDEAIDTEPEWSRDGASLYFTSDRAGSAQIYRVSADEGARAERVTYTGSYNARPRVSPDGGSEQCVDR